MRPNLSSSSRSLMSSSGTERNRRKQLEPAHSHRSSSYSVPRSSSCRGATLPFFRSAFCVPSGIDRLRTSTSLATVEKIGPSSDASAASQSCSRGLTVLSGIRCASQIVDVPPVRALRQSACRSHNSRWRSGRPWPSVYLASLVAWARQPRTVQCAEYPQAIIWISPATRHSSLRRGASVGMHCAIPHTGGTSRSSLFVCASRHSLAVS